jgi:hypothetical protein
VLLGAFDVGEEAPGGGVHPHLGGADDAGRRGQLERRGEPFALALAPLEFCDALGRERVLGPGEVQGADDPA